MKKLLLLAVVAASFAGIMQSCKPDSPDGGNYSCIKACFLIQRDHLEHKGLIAQIEEAKECLSLNFLHVKSP
jgi:hypothetical protein